MIDGAAQSAMMETFARRFGQMENVTFPRLHSQGPRFNVPGAADDKQWLGKEDYIKNVCRLDLAGESPFYCPHQQALNV